MALRLCNAPLSTTNVDNLCQENEVLSENGAFRFEEPKRKRTEAARRSYSVWTHENTVDLLERRRIAERES